MFPFTIEKLIFQLIGATMISMYWIYKWILVFNSFNACRVLLRIMNSDEMPNAAYLLFQPQYLEIIAKLIKITQCLHNFISCTLIIFFLRFAWNSEGQQSPGVIIDHHYVVSYSPKKKKIDRRYSFCSSKLCQMTSIKSIFPLENWYTRTQ